MKKTTDRNSACPDAFADDDCLRGRRRKQRCDRAFFVGKIFRQRGGFLHPCGERGCRVIGCCFFPAERDEFGLRGETDIGKARVPCADEKADGGQARREAV